MNRLPRHAAAGALTGLLLLGVPGVAAATETNAPDPTSPGQSGTGQPGTATPFVEPLVRSSRVVLSGTVEQISTDQQVGPTAVSGSVRVAVDRVFKPRGPELVTTDVVDVALARVPRTCTDATQIEPGRRYVFFAAFDEGLSSTACGGVLAATEGVLTQIEDLGFTGRDPVPGDPAPEPVAELTRTDRAEPAPFTRSAAPGAALVLIGLLGLAVVRRMARRG